MFVSRREAEKRLGMTKKEIMNKIASGEIKGQKVGKRYQIEIPDTPLIEEISSETQVKNTEEIEEIK